MLLPRWVDRFSLAAALLLLALHFQAAVSLPGPLGMWPPPPPPAVLSAPAVTSSIAAAAAQRPKLLSGGGQLVAGLGRRLPFALRAARRAWVEALSARDALPFSVSSLFSVFSSPSFWVPLALAVTVRVFLLEPRTIPSESMSPSLAVGDRLLVYKLSPRLRRGDIVVFRGPPAYVSSAVGGGRPADLVKRIVLLPGDVLQPPEPHPSGLDPSSSPAGSPLPVTLPPDMFYVLGDNRGHSYDSSCWGLLPRRNIIGKAVFRYWPPHRIALLSPKSLTYSP